ncbi:MAG: signal peptidase I [Flavobacteriaceae bacterium]|nr:signal peptidase I [Flavobacteriaceae bacterium]|tara:strand:+ start:27381 stop:29111 length:1731 start_codon:yes stop_codon:yes gene_type:complete
MTFLGWIAFFFIIQVIHFIGTWKLYEKAGKKAWQAAVPIYNAMILMEIVKRPKWWIILLFIPVVNLLMFPVFWIETIRTFGYKKRLESFLVIVTLGLYIIYINYTTTNEYNEERSLKPQSNFGEWVSSIAFAIIAATLVHTYFMQPFTIPTSSLEKSLLVGDYLFVSKFHYGARVPSTVVAAPMVHDTLPAIPIPLTGINLTPTMVSYLKSPQLPHMRLPGLQRIKNNDIVCFNWPADTLKTMWGDNSGQFTYKPVDKKTNYVKRCVGIAGDTLQMIDGYFYINGKKNVLPDRAKLQFYYTYESKKPIDRSTYPKFLIDKERTGVYKILTEYWDNEKVQKAFEQSADLTKIGEDSLYTEVAGGVSQDLASRLKMISVPNKININLTEEELERLKKYPLTASITKLIHDADDAIFPHVKELGWSQDNFGPIYIPKKGATVTLNAETIPFYEQVIKNYENNDLVINGDEIFINGSKATSYTFQQDYYWLVGDNRHNSLDARYWGFVPFDHVLGKPVMVWFSWDADAPTLGAKLKSIRWDRLFTTVHGEGEPVSYRYLVLALILLYFGYSFFKKKKVKS